MKFRSLLPTCSSAITTVDDHPIPPPKLPFSDDTNSLFSDIISMTKSPSIYSQETNSSLSSLQSNLSLLTLPSVPSLQNLSPENLNLKISVHSLSSLNPKNTHITSLSIHNNLLYAASLNEINVFELTKFTLIDTFNSGQNTGTVKSVVFIDNKFFTAHQDCKIRVWKLTPIKQHKLIATLPTLEDRFRRFVFPSSYVNVRRHKKKMWIEHHDAVSGLAVNENMMCSVSWDRSLKIWNGTGLCCMESIKAHDDAINTVVISKDGIIYTGSADKRIRVWGKTENESEKMKHELIATLDMHKSAVNALALSCDGSILFSGACDRSILVWEREDSANYMVVTGALRGHRKAILCLINVSDLLFSGSADRTVRIWTRGADGQFCCLTVLDGHRSPVRSLVAVPVAEGGDAESGVKLFSGSFDGEIKVWQIGISSSSGSPVKS